MTLPPSPIGGQARWVLDQLGLDPGAGPTAEVAAAHFSQAFLAEVAADDVAGVFDRLRSVAPWTALDADVAGSDAVIGLRSGDDRTWRMTMSVDTDGLITTLFVRPSSPGNHPPAASWAEVIERLTAFDAEVGLLAARVGVDGRCEPVAELNPEVSRPLGSIFKLYVLGAVRDAVMAGDVAWDDILTVTDDMRSLPSGKLQDEPTGTEIQVSQLAAAMIAISDNTAADMLIKLVGRDAVEAELAQMGHADPAANTPFLTTREFFTLAWGPSSARDQWPDLDEAERRQLAEAVPAGPMTVDATDIIEPTWQSGIGWTGSPMDVCAALVELHAGDLGDPDTMLRTILGHNRGGTIDPATWPYVAYKGGSAPGLLAGSWYAERQDGQHYVFVIEAASTDASALSDSDAFFSLGEDVFRLFAAYQGP